MNMYAGSNTAVGQMKIADKKRMAYFPSRCYRYFVPSKYEAGREEAFHYDYKNDWDFTLANALTDEANVKKKKLYKGLRQRIFRTGRSNSIIMNEIVGLIDLGRKTKDWIDLTIHIYRNTK